MTVNVVALDPDNGPVFQGADGRISSVRTPGDQIIGLGVVFCPVCSCCDTPLDYEERTGGAGEMYTDILCRRCFEWVGRTLVGWLGTDGRVAQIGDEPVAGAEELPDEFWIDSAQIDAAEWSL